MTFDEPERERATLADHLIVAVLIGGPLVFWAVVGYGLVQLVGWLS